MKKETQLSVLQEIRDLLKAQTPQVAPISAKAPSFEEKDGWVLMDFPQITAKELIEEYDNKTSVGTPILYEINWYKDEKFFTTEKTRPGKRWMQKEIGNKGKSWTECNKLAKEQRYELPSFAELLYFLVEYERITGTRLMSDWEFPWTNSRASGGKLVYVGAFDGGGASVGSYRPVVRLDVIGSSFSRS